MPKHNKDTKVSSKPYSRPNPHDNRRSKTITTMTDNKKRKPITKSEKVKNADITNQLDNLMEDLSSHLTQPKKNKGNKKDKNMDQKRLEEEQQRYEQTQNDMDDALGLLQNL